MQFILPFSSRTKLSSNFISGFSNAFLKAFLIRFDHLTSSAAYRNSLKEIPLGLVWQLLDFCNDKNEASELN